MIVDVQRIPHWGRVAFLARATDQLMPLFDAGWRRAPDSIRSALQGAIIAAQTAARSGAIDEQTSEALDWCQTIKEQLSQPSIPNDRHACPANSLSLIKLITQAVETATRCALTAPNESAVGTEEGWNLVVRAAHQADAKVIITRLESDYQRLLQASRRNRWDDLSPIPEDAFNPMFRRLPEKLSFLYPILKRIPILSRLVGDQLIKLNASERLRHQEQIEPEHLNERKELLEHLFERIERYLRKIKIPPVNDVYEWVFTRDCLNPSHNKLAITISIYDPNAYRAGLIDELNELLADYPAWKLVLTYDKYLVVVSRNGIEIGTVSLRLPIEDDTPEFRNWIRDIFRADARQYDALREQYRAVEQLIPEAITRLQSESATVLQAHSKYGDEARDEDNTVVWILQLGAQGPESIRPGGNLRLHPVDAEGKIQPFRRYSPEDAPAYYLHLHEFCWEDRQILEMYHRGKSRDEETTVTPLPVYTRKLPDTNPKHIKKHEYED